MPRDSLSSGHHCQDVAASRMRPSAVTFPCILDSSSWAAGVCAQSSISASSLFWPLHPSTLSEAGVPRGAAPDFVCFQYITQLCFRTAFLCFLSGKFCVIQDLQVLRVSERVRETQFSCSAISSGIFHFSSLILSTQLLGNLNETNILLHFFCVILA